MKTPKPLCQNSLCRIAACLIVCLSAGALTARSVRAADHDAIKASRRAASYLIEEGDRWIKKRGCVSCHQVPAMLWSLHALNHSRDREIDGLAVQDLQRWSSWAVDPVNFVKPEQKKDVEVEATLASNIDTMAAMLLAIPDDDASGENASGETDLNWRKMFIQALCREQQQDGSWKACGQLPMQKRPKRETNAATTLWVTFALSRSGCEDFDFAAALEYADGGKPAVSTEWYAVRAIVAAQQDDGGDTAGFHQKRLLELQNEDGGWGWIARQESDALATGIALYALSNSYATKASGDRVAEQASASVPTSIAVNTSVARASNYLTRTQTETGSWKVPGTKASAKGRATATANYWGTAWAVVGLTSTATLSTGHE